MKQLKIAISLAVVGAIVAPFVLRTYKMRPLSDAWVPYTAEQKSRIAANLARTNNCQTLSDRVKEFKLEGKPPTTDFMDAVADERACRLVVKDLQAGGRFQTHRSAGKYLAFNAAAAAAGFISIFGLTFLLPAIVRRYRRWFNT